MARIFIGIDPGMEGALARVGAQPEDVVITDTPTLATENSAGRARRIYDEGAMARELRSLAGIRHGQAPDDVAVCIEQVHSMPKQGVASAFTFGTGYGIWLGIIAALGLPSVRVEPRRWKKDVLADGPKTDQAVAAVAARLYPGTGPLLETARGRLLLGRADALLIAHWLRTSGRV